MEDITKKLKAVKIIHFAIFVGLVVVYIVIGELLSVESIAVPAIDSSSVVYFLIPVVSIVLGNVLYKLQIKKSDPSLNLVEKVAIYHKATITRLAVLEGGAFIILFMKPEFILLGILIILYMFFLRPSESKFRKDFDIPSE